MKKILLLSLALLAFACSKNATPAVEKPSPKGEWLVTSIKLRAYDVDDPESDPNMPMEEDEELDFCRIDETLTIKDNQIIPCASVDQDYTEKFSNMYKGYLECTITDDSITLPATVFENTYADGIYTYTFPERVYKYTITGDVMQLNLSADEVDRGHKIHGDAEILLKRQFN